MAEGPVATPIERGRERPFRFLRALIHSHLTTTLPTFPAHRVLQSSIPSHGRRATIVQ